MIFISSLTKRAQFPFSSWLPAAISAPTPVSSLVHSSTLVTAGVYLLIRFNDLIVLEFRFILFILSFLTSFISSFGAFFEYDLKKIVAFSTLSQLGFIIIILRIGNWKLCFFHLFIHALFKSLLFICSGKIIHLSFNNQDVRKYGSLIKSNPILFFIFFSSLLRLMGFPFFSGFYSKDLILENVIFFSDFYGLILFICALFTGIYRLRLINLILFGKYKFFSINLYSENNIILFPIIILLFIRIMGGSFMYWVLFYEIKFLIIDIKIKLILFFIIFFCFIIYYYFVNLKLKNFFIFSCSLSYLDYFI